MYLFGCKFTGDVLTNGADNVFEQVHLQLIGKPPGIIWVQFDYADVDKKNTKIDIYENKHLCRRHWPTVDIN